MWCDRFFWLALYAQPGLWVALSIVAILRFEFKWLSLIGKSTASCYSCLKAHWRAPFFRARDTWRPLRTSCWEKGNCVEASTTSANVDSCSAIALVLTITNTLAFSRCDKFSQASNLASSAMYSGGMARSLAGGIFSRLFTRS